MSQDARYDEELATARRARLLGLSYADTSQVVNKPLYDGVLDKRELWQMRVIPLQMDKSNILFGVTTTTSQQTMEGLVSRFPDQKLAFAIISDSGFKDYMKLYDPPKQIVYHDIDINDTEQDEDELIESISQMLDQVKADDMLAYLVQQAHRLNASDIHIETQKDHVRIRIRIDGVLHPVAHLAYEKYRILVSAVASAGNVSSQTDEAQQGHISEHVHMADGSDVDINIRLETVPTVNGMDIVMRLFNMEASMYVLDKLELSPQEREVVDDIVSKPHGLTMMVGPTGSGKTTTLYSILNTLNTEERKIITIEDPVEYQFEGITQISVHSTEEGNDESFAGKLRATLRLDPDIVMVGEIRDMDTARTALQGALTGHLVLSTFHANNASAALTRMMDVIGQNSLFVTAIRLVMAQRLVRRLDDETKQAYDPDEATMRQIREVVDSFPDNIEKPDLDGLQLYKPGRSNENPFGFKGQVPVREQFQMNGELRELLSNNTKILSAQEIEAAAIKSGMRTMLHDGILKVIDGQTTLDEVYRVIG